MFFTSSARVVDSQLQKLVDEVEAQSSYLSVLAARQFRYSLHQTPVEVTISEPRKFNVLEEFILRAGIELDPPPTEDELAAVLGLDPVFVRSTTTTLRKLQTLAGARTSKITVTSQGRQFYQQGTVAQPPYRVQIYAVADPLLGNLTFYSEPIATGLVNQPDLANFITLENRAPDVSSLQLEELQQLVQAASLGLHVPEEGKIITSYSLAAPSQIIWKTISLFSIFDMQEDRVRLQVRRGKQILEDVSKGLEKLQSEDKIFLQALCGLSEETIAFESDATFNQKNADVETRLEKIRQQALKPTRETRTEGVSAEQGDIALLRDSQMSHAFLEALNSARSNVLIYLPWIGENVVSDEFIQLLQELAKRGVLVLIGYGMPHKSEGEEWAVSPEIEAKVKGIRTVEGLLTVQVFYLGNSHAKEVVVDSELYLCTSPNWISDRGNWLPVGENFFKVADSKIVQEAYKDLAGRFQNHAQQLWDEAVQNGDSKLAEVAVSIWGTLSLEEMALNQLQQNNFLELLPVWLKVALHRLRFNNLSPESPSFATALSLLAGISEAEPYIESLREIWPEVVHAIASCNPSIAITLLNDEVWSQCTRLDIFQSSIDSPEQLISKYTAGKKQPAKTSQRKRTSPTTRKTKPKK